MIEANPRPQKPQWLYRVLKWSCVLMVLWFVYVAYSYSRHYQQSREIATETLMTHRTFSVLPNPIQPIRELPGDERLLVVGKGYDDYLLASIVRNPEYVDYRSQWKVDIAIHTDEKGRRTSYNVWDRFDAYPTQAQIDRFRKLYLQLEWVVWDSPEPDMPPWDAGADDE